jgi:hypothetical protein
MSAATNYLEDLILNALLQAAPMMSWVDTYMALFEADPGEAGSLANEVVGNAYARQPMAGVFPVASGGGTILNTSAVNFPVASGNYPNPITHWGLCDDLTGGNLLIYSTALPNQTILITQFATFGIGSLLIGAD